MKMKTLLAAGLLGLMSLGSVTAAPIKIGYSDWPGYTVLEVQCNVVAGHGVSFHPMLKLTLDVIRDVKRDKRRAPAGCSRS